MEEIREFGIFISRCDICSSVFGSVQESNYIRIMDLIFVEMRFNFRSKSTEMFFSILENMEIFNFADDCKVSKDFLIGKMGITEPVEFKFVT